MGKEISQISTRTPKRITELYESIQENENVVKLTQSKLKEIIREEIQKLNEGLPWEQGLEENWFSDLKATAKKAYIKANPGSKYAKAVKSGEKNAPMTKKDKKKWEKDFKAAKDKEKGDAISLHRM